MSNQPKFGEWIKCRERLPEEGARVLVRSTIWRTIIADRGATTWTNSAGGTDNVFDTQFNNSSVTHWMPLPEAPNE